MDERGLTRTGTEVAAVTLVTALAEAMDMGDDEYRAIYERVARGRSLRNVELALRSGVSFGWWAKYASGERSLDRERKNELRRWARENGGPDLADLPLTPVEVVAGCVHPDAAVYRVGSEVASRVVLVGADVAAALVQVNGSCRVLSDALAPGSQQARCNGRYSQQPRGTIHLDRARWERLNDARLRVGQTWEEFLAPLGEGGQ